MPPHGTASGGDRRRHALWADRTTRRVWTLYAVLGLCLLAYLVSEIVRRPGQTSTALDGWGVAGFELVASLLCLGRAVGRPRGWPVALALGVGLLSWSVGDFVLTAESLGGATPPVPSLADAFYLFSYPCAYAGVMLLVRRQVKRLSVASWLDGAVAGLGAAAICAEFAFKTVASSAGGGVASVATDLAYPVGDLLLLVLVVGVTTVLPGRRHGRWMLLAAGYVVNAVGDTSNLFHASFGSTHLGTLLNAVAWPTSTLLVSASVWLPTRRRGLVSPERPPGLVLPALSALAALVILLVAGGSRSAHVAAGLAAATLLLAGVRCGLALRRLGVLTEERRSQAITDELTGLGNRRALFETLAALLDPGRDSEEPNRLAFLFVDLNRFKEINDSFGHAVGDELLRQLGTRLRGSLRGSDLLVRLGGDEFAVVLMDADADYGATIAGRISARLAEPFQLGQVKAHIGASIGIAVVPADATDPAELLRLADLAMYRAKVAGKDFAIYQHEIDGNGNRLGLVNELREAIDRGGLELHYQPQVAIGTGEIVSVEALVRWQHPELGYIPPLEFVPLAEDAGLMDALTAAVLDGALRQCAAWRAEGRSLTVSVNISTTNLLDPALPRLVRDCLHRHALGPETLVLEITETTAISDFARGQKAIQALRDLGVVVAVDDFGAGFTSLAYLSSLAVGELKLDRSFISGLSTTGDPRDLALVRSTIELAHSLRLRVVAEGVEDAETMAVLSELHCDLAQGYLISRPRPAAELEFEPFTASAGDGAPGYAAAEVRARTART